MVTAPVVFSDMGTGEIPAHPSSEEPTMNFTLRLLDGDPSATGQPLVLSSGSVIHLEASVHFSPSFSMKIHVDQCYGTITEQLGHSRKVFMVVNSRGCLHGDKLGNVSVQHQRGSSALQLSILAPTPEGEPEQEELLLVVVCGCHHGMGTCHYTDKPHVLQLLPGPVWGRVAASE
ncbi:zona pellucida sperm-binding protein 3-like protein [Willisornis vidua]|uniref:Zona pellucida sperm-binding protein 3-like protein n=1 Tax=Willisornis vidua TaxID=1566151 RepID=A0ABQ9DX90_9PASS|nr:zona pellucida sperm-binding protein 3-like protein [Willisornis vidua]